MVSFVLFFWLLVAGSPSSATYMEFTKKTLPSLQGEGLYDVPLLYLLSWKQVSDLTIFATNRCALCLLSSLPIVVRAVATSFPQAEYLRALRVLRLIDQYQILTSVIEIGLLS